MHRTRHCRMAHDHVEPKRFAAWIGAFSCLFCVCNAGCKRGFYLRTADRDAYCLIDEKGNGPTWALDPGFNVEPDARSRFYDPTCKTDPTLPVPAPQLYDYEVPPLVSQAAAPRELHRKAAGYDPEEDELIAEEAEAEEAKAEEAKAEEAESQSDRASEKSKLNTGDSNQTLLESTTIQDHTAAASVQATSLASYVRAGTSDEEHAITPERLPIVFAAPIDFQVDATSKPNELKPDELKSDELKSDELKPDELKPDELKPDGRKNDVDPTEAIAIASLDEPLGQTPLPELGAIPQEAWLSLPSSCLKRMLEFDTVRAEYERSFESPVDESQLDAAQRVNLENILEIALINSRDYQARKETLYRVALRLSLQRFDYESRFLSRGNGTSLGYTHDRRGGIENNTLRAQTGLGLTKSLYTGGDMVARFANDVVLTFNGPSGFSSSVGSEIFIDLFQPIMQRDVRFESLTQAERDVVYAARDFVRVRKLLFRDLAAQYYTLLLTYRRIAINTQDYFSNLREFNRAAATEKAGRIPLFQVDQFEQNVLRSRGDLIDSCNALEGSIDRLKIRIGLPTELPINLALQELEDLTLTDEANVFREQLTRKSRVFLQQQEREGTAVALPALTEVARRLLSLAEVNERIGQADEAKTAEFAILVSLLETEEKRIEAKKNEALLEKNSLAADNEAQVLPAQLFIRSKEVLRLTLDSIRQELLLLSQINAQATESLSEKGSDPLRQGQKTNKIESPPKGQTPFRTDTLQLDELEKFRARWLEEVKQYETLELLLKDVPFAEQAASLPKLIAKSQQQLLSAKQLDQNIRVMLERSGLKLAQNDKDVERLVEVVFAARNSVSSGSGLAALDVDMDEAMLTALVQRLDLMNQRDQIADSWRLIKYAGDDLRSILNLRATQSIRTPAGANKPFDFSFKDSTTRLTMDFDTPLNRRSERNFYRLALIDYNVSLRNLIEAQDSIKLSVRDNLRAIELDRNQYDIAIASAALAYDRVTSTRMQVALGQGNVTARDFLEAQQAYTQSLNAVAQQHISYINDRIRFFVDVEQLQVDPVNFWPDLRNEDYPFLPNTDFPSASPNGYGELPRGPWYSRSIRRMKGFPPGQANSQNQTTAPLPVAPNE